MELHSRALRVMPVGIILLLASCITNPNQNQGITAIAKANIHFSSIPQPMYDFSAIVGANDPIVNPPSHTERCLADPNSPPIFVNPGEVSVAASAPGQCKFGDLTQNTFYNFTFQSGFCHTFHARSETIGNSITDTCSTDAWTAASADSHFSVSGASPSNVTVSTNGIITTYGAPQLVVYNSRMQFINRMTASSVAPDGTSATFPFPTTSTGASLPNEFYLFAIQNNIANNDHRIIDGTYYSVGANTTLTTPFGIDAFDIQTWTRVCIVDESGKPHCSTSPKTTIPTPILTLYDANQVSYKGQTIAVGTQPIAIKAYAVTTGSVFDPNEEVTTFTSAPSRAIVLNFGSNTASILDLNNSSTVKTINVGTQPVAVTLKSDGTRAYVANYGSGTVAEIDLTTQTSGRTISVGSNPQSLTMDPAGNAVWVAGQSYIKKIDLTTFTVTATQSVAGTVTSVATSNQQNTLVYSLVNDGAFFATSGGSQSGQSSSTYTVQELHLGDLTNGVSYGASLAVPYSTYTMNGTLPNSTLAPGATQVSAQWANGMAASATPTGFVIYDVVNHVELMRGTTATPVRGIASDPNNWVVYLTTPDSNSYITVPLPHF
jgi:YVTN family beta-propeller protein